MKFKSFLFIALISSFCIPMAAADDQNIADEESSTSIEASEPESKNQQILLPEPINKFLHGALLGGLGYNAFKYMCDNNKPSLASNIVYNSIGVFLSAMPSEYLGAGVNDRKGIAGTLTALPMVNLGLSFLSNLQLYGIPLFFAGGWVRISRKTPETIIRDCKNIDYICGSHAQYMAIHYPLLYLYNKYFLKDNANLDNEVYPPEHLSKSWKSCTSASQKASFTCGAFLGALAIKKILPLSKKYIADTLGTFFVDTFGVPPVAYTL